MKKTELFATERPRSNPVLHMVCGKIASGKSTLAKALASESNTIILSEDVWMTHLYPNEISSLADYIRCSGRVKHALSGHVQTLLAMGISVVLDFPFNTIKNREWGRTLFSSVNAKHQLHYLDVGDDVCKARLRARNASGEHPFHTTESQFEEMTRFFVPPTQSEGFNVVVHGSA
jgi:predicted kinase